MLIGYLSFKAFNEGGRLKDCVRLQQKLMKKRIRIVVADSIYVHNANRKFCTLYRISPSFVRKGRATKDEKQRKTVCSGLSRERAARPEGSLGTPKQHYSLDRIKARNRKTEIPGIFLGMHPLNAVFLIEKVKRRKEKAA